MNPQSKPRLVILGTGFAAFSFVKDADKEIFDITVISPRNHFLFTPLLPSTTVGTLEFRSIIEPIRNVPSISYIQAYCTAVDTGQRLLHCESTLEKKQSTIPYDILVIAVGAVSNTFNVPGVPENVLFLKDLADARAIRQRIIDCLETASQPFISYAERAQLLHFVVVGGGPTGVEFAAELHDFIKEDLVKPYLPLIPHIKISLLEASEHILSSFDATLQEFTLKHFLRNSIEVQTHSPVTRIDAGKIYLKDGSEIPFGLVVWSTGNAPTDFVRSLPFQKDKQNRITVNGDLQVTGMENIYAVGDNAVIENNTLPATAQVAIQQGKYLAKALTQKQKNIPHKPFQYRHYGMLAYIGGAKALADLSSIKGKGFTTWLFWRSAYLNKLVSFKNKTLVFFDWTKTIFFGRDISRF